MKKLTILSPVQRVVTVLIVSASALVFSACDNTDDSGNFGAPDRYTEDPAADKENPPPAPGSVGGVDPSKPENQATVPQPDSSDTDSTEQPETSETN